MNALKDHKGAEERGKELAQELVRSDFEPSKMIQIAQEIYGSSVHTLVAFSQELKVLFSG